MISTAREASEVDRITQATRAIAAKLVVEGRARLATASESEAYRSEVQNARERAEQLAAAGRVQVSVISDAELRLLRDRARPLKGRGRVMAFFPAGPPTPVRDLKP